MLNVPARGKCDVQLARRVELPCDIVGGLVSEQAAVPTQAEVRADRPAGKCQFGVVDQAHRQVPHERMQELNRCGSGAEFRNAGPLAAVAGVTLAQVGTAFGE